MTVPFLLAAEPHEPHTPLSHPLLWGGFAVFLLVCVLIDLGLDRRSRGTMSTRAALVWSAVWIALAMTFNAGLFVFMGRIPAEEFLAGYLLEKSLSVDNLFVFVLVFAFFRTPPHQQRRVLTWGILGAMVLRAAMILLGAALIHQFHYTLALFGLFLVYSGLKLLGHDEEEDPSDSRLIRLLRRVLPLTEGSLGSGGAPAKDGNPAHAMGYRGNAFWVHEGGKLRFTPLFLVLLVIEASDVIFAVDSVPAIFGVTSDPFIVFTSNMFAILGLRALFFAIAAAIQRLQYLNYGLSLVLTFIGVKMLLPFVHEAAHKTWGVDLTLPFLEPGLHVSTGQSLGVICLTLGITAAISLLGTAPPAEGGEPPAGGAPAPLAAEPAPAAEPRAPGAPEPAAAQDAAQEEPA